MSIHPHSPLVVGVDFGTLSGRAVVVRVADGAELGNAVTEYPHAVVDRLEKRDIQGYVETRAGETYKRTGQKTKTPTIKKELGTLSSIWNRWATRKGPVHRPLSLRELEYPKRREKPVFQTWEQIERRIAPPRAFRIQEHRT